MTKVILTAVHDYTCRLSGLRVYTLVGDDEIALHSQKEVLYRHLFHLEQVGFKVSEDDTFVSRHLAFYCEEGCIVPQTVRSTVHVQMRRGKELSYLDYPRIRLLLPVTSETQGYSQTNIGRFALLGKETKWAFTTNVKAGNTFAVAGLVQHLLVPQDRDTKCPYTPLEVGGDGAFPHSAEFMGRVITAKGGNPNEVRYRLHSLLTNKFGRKFVRSDRLDKVVHKHHLYLPKMEGLKELLPKEALIVPEDDNVAALLQSMQYEDLESPERTFFRIARGLYYQALLQGRTPVEPKFDLDKSFTLGQTENVSVNLHRFIERWKSPGFKFQDFYGYFVHRSAVSIADPLNLKWEFGKDLPPKAKELFTLWVQENMSIKDRSLGEILDCIRSKKALPNWVVDRLNLFVESDSYILHMLGEVTNPYVGIVTRDQKLGAKVRDYYIGHGQEEVIVYLLDPAAYLTGRTTDFIGKLVAGYRVEIPDLDWIQDPGAILHVDYNEFEDGFPLDENIWDRETRIVHTRYDRVVLLTFEGQRYHR